MRTVKAATYAHLSIRGLLTLDLCSDFLGRLDMLGIITELGIADKIRVAGTLGVVDKFGVGDVLGELDTLGFSDSLGKTEKLKIANTRGGEFEKLEARDLLGVLDVLGVEETLGRLYCDLCQKFLLYVADLFGVGDLLTSSLDCDMIGCF